MCSCSNATAGSMSSASEARKPVIVIAATDDDKLVPHRTVQASGRRECDRVPAGLIGDDGENDPAATATEGSKRNRLSLRAPEQVAKGPSSSGITSEIVYFFRAYDLTKVSKGGGIGEEKITVHLVDRLNVRRMAARSASAAVR